MKIRYIEINNFRGIKQLAYPIKSDFICLIGAGDSCKSTILDAIDYTLSPRWNLNIDDSDFFNQDVLHPIEIKLTLSDWDQDDDEVKKFLLEKNFGQYQCGINESGSTSEPEENDSLAIVIILRIDESLEPKWYVTKEDEKHISASQRNIFGVSRIGMYLDNHFSWQQNSLLTRLSNHKKENMTSILAKIARDAKSKDIDLPDCQVIEKQISDETKKIGVNLSALKSKVDIQRIAFSSSALTLHQEDVPIRNLGDGSKKLISCAMQMLLNNGKNISLIDEIEVGLEPHRIRGLLNKLKLSRQQVFITSHSPVVIRELNVSKNELYVCKRSSDGTVTLTSFKDVENSQGSLRSNAEAFLGRKIVVCEGATEIGCLRALDIYKSKNGDIPVWSLSTAYFDAGGIDKIKKSAEALQQAGYYVLIFCDNDEPTKLTQKDLHDLEKLNIPSILWNEGNSIEQQLFIDIPWGNIAELLKIICENNDVLSEQSMIDSVKSKLSGNEKLSNNFCEWNESESLRNSLGISAKNKGWFKTIDRAERVFEFVLPKLPASSLINAKLMELWNWIQNDG
ncbi:ATP-dependent nuclease [Legionella septentrionalis]|uniref:ATP-dependent nuclease n=1 Tax=Legionella septentrionalis TaxID=2498109 RepID=UPI000F8F67EB|nr:ATP-binding protein [Legionella septentrionalis]RUR00593.1 ATP-binding protein [Legionella septentrionalis]